MNNIDLSLLTDDELQSLLNTNDIKALCLNKKSKCHSTQNSIKISGINSLYGAMGSIYCNLFDVDMAESVTATGRALIQYVSQEINAALNTYFNTQDVEYVFYNDTDSSMLKLAPDATDIDIEMAIKICKTVVQESIKTAFEDLYDVTNAYDKTCLEMEMESIVERGFVVKRKNYYFKIKVDEGHKILDEAKDKITGLESKKAAKYSQFCRDKIKHCYDIILEKDQRKLLEYTRDVFDNFTKFNIQDVCNYGKVNNLHKYDTNFPKFQKGTPINSKAALTYNHYVGELNLSGKYKNIEEGDRIKYVKLKKNNHILSSSIAWIGTDLPEEFRVEDFFDWEDLFYLNFLKPVERIAKAVKWNVNLKLMTQFDLF